MVLCFLQFLSNIFLGLHTLSVCVLIYTKIRLDFEVDDDYVDGYDDSRNLINNEDHDDDDDDVITTANSCLLL